MPLELVGPTELDLLYAELAPRLRRILGASMDLPDCVAEDACQAAWTALLESGADVDRPRMLSWLATTARREALTMLKRAEFERRALEQTPLHEVSDPHAAAARFRDRLGEVRRLSQRQQQMIWMQGLGFDYHEIAARTGESRRTVERQLALARIKLGSAA